MSFIDILWLLVGLILLVSIGFVCKGNRQQRCLAGAILVMIVTGLIQGIAINWV